MPVIIEEKLGSRRSTTGENASVELTYVINDAVDDIDAKTELATFAPAVYDGLIRKTIAIEPVTDTVWEGIVRYGQFDNSQPNAGDSTFSFDIGGGSQRITQSKLTVSGYAPSGGAPPNFQGAIGVTPNGIEGVDIIVPTYNFSETHYIPANLVDGPFKATIFNLTGKVNGFLYKGFQIGECLFLGASGTLRANSSDPSGGDWEITYRFSALPNVIGLTIGDIVGIDKEGWQYLWVRYTETEDQSAGALVQRLAAVYIERVYDYGDLSFLGIGV